MATLLFVLHLLGAVVWVGGLTFAILVLRPAAHEALEGPQRLALMQSVFRRFFRVLWHAVPLVLLTGWALLAWSYWGFGASVWHVHLMHLTGLVMAGIFAFVALVLFRRMREALAAGQPAAAVAAMDRIRIGVIVNLALGLLTVAVAGWGRYGG